MMKLFAVGTTDPNPSKWSPWDEIDLILAATAEEALDIHGYKTADVVEVDMRLAQRVMSMPAYKGSPLEDFDM